MIEKKMVFGRFNDNNNNATWKIDIYTYVGNRESDFG